MSGILEISLSRRIVFTGETQLMQHVIPSSRNSNSNWDHVQGTEIVNTSSQVSGIIPSARSYSAGVLDQTLELQIEQSRSHHSAQSNPGDPHWNHKEEQRNTNKTGMEYSHRTVAEDKIKSHQIFNTSNATNPERQYSQRENIYDHTKQNISKVSIYSGKLDSNQSGVVDYIPEEKVYKNATLSTPHFSNTLKNETHQIEIPGKHHGNEQLTLHRQPDGRDAVVLEQSVESTTQKHTILTQNQSSYSNKYGGYGVTSTVSYLMDVLEKKHNGPYNTTSLPQGTEQMAIPPSQQDRISQFSPSESVISTPSAKSDAPMPYSQPNSGEEHEPRMHSSPVFRWKNQWTMKGWLIQAAKDVLYWVSQHFWVGPRLQELCWILVNTLITLWIILLDFVIFQGIMASAGEIFIISTSELSYCFLKTFTIT